MFVWALKYWKYIALVLALLALYGVFKYTMHKEYRKGWDQCTLAQEKAEIEGVKTRETIKTKFNRYSPSDVDKRLIAKWLRG